MKYVSTRNSQYRVSAAEAIVRGIAPDGGLFVPESFPSLSLDRLRELSEMEYPERVASILSMYLDDYSYEELLDYARQAYSRFDDEGACPILNLDEGLYIMELFHGPTFAFKDLALTLLPHLMSAARRKLDKTDKTLILVATSGDTGKAALEGFKDVAGTGIIVFYPAQGVSDLQKMQMETTTGGNVYVSGINGNFDDAQTAVKQMFGDADFAAKLQEKGYSLSSANSINWGRLVPQICYYVSAYCDIAGSGEIEFGDEINFVVPTGNFGNILAGYYAKQMGLPVGRLICASNQNNILTDFFASGEYDTNREFFRSISPSMDILVSSNLERLIFEMCGRDSEYVAELYRQLKSDKKFVVDEKYMANTGDFVAGYADEEDTQDMINSFYNEFGYVLDPHTAVAMYVYYGYHDESEDDRPCVVVSTASPFKFAKDVYLAIDQIVSEDSFKAIKDLHSSTMIPVPGYFKYIKDLQRNFTDVCDIADMPNAVLTAVDRFKE